jgi:ABC-type multidrug transport system ATPase subunit/uncharacterized tellurite resistance protein B-like protein
MSEPILRAIIRLFAIVAKEDLVNKQERDQIAVFLNDHVGQRLVGPHLAQFDSYCEEIANHNQQQEENEIDEICRSINIEVAQKQKMVIIIELLSIVMADGTVTAREEQLSQKVAGKLHVSEADLAAMRQYVLGRTSEELEDESILIIDSVPGRSGKGKYIHREALDGCIAILHLRSTESYFFKYTGRTDVYLNSVPQKPGNIHVLATGSLIRWASADPVYFGEILGRFKTMGNLHRTSFIAQDISFTFKNGKLGLRDVHIAEESGGLIALMGASGAGKSTLLHVLNGSEKPSSGRVLINGIDIHKEPQKVKGVVGFVPQDDLLIEDLTVYQNLYFAAKLCFSRLSEMSINKLVMKTLDDLGLSETKHLKVGSPLRKTISGGQRKRLNIGLELLREPAILFCDEPTSGLSSRDSENIIDLLKELSLKGKLVFTVIHQPSSDIFKMFDKLVILDIGGYQIYYGNPVDAVSYFKQNINLVNSAEGECAQCGNVNPEQIFNIIETKVINEYGNFTHERKFTPDQWNQIYLQRLKRASVETSRETPQSTLSIPRWIKQARIFSARDLLSKLSNQQYLVINLVEAPLLAFILAFIVRFYNVDDPFHSGYVFSKNLNLPAYLFMSVIVALFMGLTVSAEEIIRDRKILKRETFLNLSRSSYIVSKIGILFMISAIQTFLFVAVGNYILEIRGMFFANWSILFAASCFANLLGLNISSAFNSAVTIYILIPILLIPQLILSGVVVKFDKLNPIMGNTATVPFVGDLMASRWAFEAAMVAQYKDNRFEKEFYESDKAMAMADYKKIYHIPTLETKLGFVRLNQETQDPAVREQVAKDFTVLRNELLRELDYVHKTDFESLDKLQAGKFDSLAFNECTAFLEALRRFYAARYTTADRAREKLIEEMTSSSEKESAYESLRISYQNESVAELVKNMAETNRIIEKDGKLIQKFYPIYKDPSPDHLLDFNAQFYVPTKHFLGLYIDTFLFNILVLWSMTAFLTIMLYYEVLRKVVDTLGNISNPLPKRM